MDRHEEMWSSLSDPEYRREYSADVGTGLAFQIKLLREKHGWTQEHLAERTGKKQETISQWENPNYGSYTLNSLKSLAAAFDVALMVRFAPFSELVDWSVNLTPGRLAPRSFDEEEAKRYESMLAPHSIPLSRQWTWATTAQPIAQTSVFFARLSGTVATGVVMTPDIGQTPTVLPKMPAGTSTPREQKAQMSDAA